METFEDDRGMFGPDERVAMRDVGIHIEIPEPIAIPDNVGDAVQPPIDLDGGLNHYPGEEPQNHVENIAKTLKTIHDLSAQIACTDAFQHASAVHRMAETRADLTRHLPDVF